MHSNRHPQRMPRWFATRREQTPDNLAERAVGLPEGPTPKLQIDDDAGMPLDVALGGNSTRRFETGGIGWTGDSSSKILLLGWPRFAATLGNRIPSLPDLKASPEAIQTLPGTQPVDLDG